MRRRAGLVVAAVLGLALSGCGAQHTTTPGAAVPGDDTALRLLPLGDSITFGNTVSPEVVPGGYRGYLGADLDAAGVRHVFVGTSVLNPPPGVDPAAYPHDGWPGRRTEQVQQALVADSPLDGGHWLDGTGARAGIDPDVVIVHLGTNDIGQAFDPGTAYPGGYTPTDAGERQVFVQHLTDRLLSLVETIRTARPDARVVLCTIVPMQDPTAAAYNQAIRDVVVPLLRARGTEVELADVERALAGVVDGVSVDLVHPTAVGYQAMAVAIAAAVEDLTAAS